MASSLDDSSSAPHSQDRRKSYAKPGAPSRTAQVPTGASLSYEMLNQLTGSQQNLPAVGHAPAQPQEKAAAFPPFPAFPPLQNAPASAPSIPHLAQAAPYSSPSLQSAKAFTSGGVYQGSFSSLDQIQTHPAQAQRNADILQELRDDFQLPKPQKRPQSSSSIQQNPIIQSTSVGETSQIQNRRPPHVQVYRDKSGKKQTQRNLRTVGQSPQPIQSRAQIQRRHAQHQANSADFQMSYPSRRNRVKEQPLQYRSRIPSLRAVKGTKKPKKQKRRRRQAPRVPREQIGGWASYTDLPAIGHGGVTSNISTLWFVNGLLFFVLIMGWLIFLLTN